MCTAARALTSDDIGVAPAQRISDRAFVDGNTGKYIKLTPEYKNQLNAAMGNNPVATAPTTANNLFTSTVTSTQSAANRFTSTSTLAQANSVPSATATVPTTPATPAAAATTGTSTAATTGANAAAAGAATSGATAAAGGTSGLRNVASQTATKWKGMSTMSKAGTVLGAVGGAAMVYDATSGNTEHSGWDVASGVGGGAMTGAAIGNVVPVIGPAIGAAAGAIIGGLASGSQLFSETDCLHDPVTGLFTCCNTLFNGGQRNVEIGGYMFCGTDSSTPEKIAPMVRQCRQGGNEKPASWWDGLWLDDAWEPECVVRYCAGVTPPPENSIVQYIPDPDNICWRWEPTTTSSITTPDGQIINANDPYAVLIYKIETERNNIISQCGDMM